MDERHAESILTDQNPNRLSGILFVLSFLILLLALLILTVGGGFLVSPALILVLVTAIVGLPHGMFHMTAETWAAEAAARSGSIPEIYNHLEAWIGDDFRLS